METRSRDLHQTLPPKTQTWGQRLHILVTFLACTRRPLLQYCTELVGVDLRSLRADERELAPDKMRLGGGSV